jgi:hypothetical protein
MTKRVRHGHRMGEKRCRVNVVARHNVATLKFSKPPFSSKTNGNAGFAKCGTLLGNPGNRITTGFSTESEGV